MSEIRDKDVVRASNDCNFIDYPLWRTVLGLALRLKSYAAVLFAAICLWFGLRWLTIEHLRAAGITVSLSGAGCGLFSIVLYRVSQTIYPIRRPW